MFLTSFCRRVSKHSRRFWGHWLSKILLIGWMVRRAGSNPLYTVQPMRTQSVQPMRTQGLVQPMRTQWLVQPITCTPSTPWHALPALMVFLPGLVEFFCTYFSSICRSSIGRLIFFRSEENRNWSIGQKLIGQCLSCCQSTCSCPDGQSTCNTVQYLSWWPEYLSCSPEYLSFWPVYVLLASICAADQ